MFVTDWKSLLIKYQDHRDKMNLADLWDAHETENKRDKLLKFVGKVLANN